MVNKYTQRVVSKAWNHQCAVCGRNDYLEFHHLIPASEGGSDECDNIILLCSFCHAAVHGRTLTSEPRRRTSIDYESAKPILELWINNAITNYIRELIRDLRKEIGAIKDDLEAQGKKPYEIKNALKLASDKLYLLQKKRWLVTKNQKNVNYQYETFYDRHFNCQMNTYRYEDLLFKYYPKLKDLRDLKERYITFNSRNAVNPEQASIELDELIKFYAACGEPIFINFSQLLKRFRQPIINSFIMMTKIVSGDKHNSRLSNGPMESLNRKAKDLKRLCRGFSNFEHLRNRFLFAARTNPALDGKDA